jgi:hypothetical protein
MTILYHRHIPARGGLCEWRRQGTLTINLWSGIGSTFTSVFLIKTQQDSKLYFKKTIFTHMPQLHWFFFPLQIASNFKTNLRTDSMKEIKQFKNWEISQNFVFHNSENYTLDITKGKIKFLKFTKYILFCSEPFSHFQKCKN